MSLLPKFSGRARFAALGLVAAAAAIAGPLAAGAGASTGSVAVTIGSLGFASTPGNVTFSPVTLNGLDQTQTQNLTMDASDATGSGAGWNIQVAVAAWKNGLNTATGITTSVPSAPTTACDSNSNCSTANNGISTYPITLSTVASKIYDAQANSGMGNQTVTSSFKLTLPSQVVLPGGSGTFSSTWTVTINSGP